MGRKIKELDEELIADLAFRGASNREIAALAGCDEGTIRGRFSAIVTKRRAERRIALRDAQTSAAIGGNATLLIWLGKNELEQSDGLQAKPTLTKVKVTIGGKPDRSGDRGGDGPATDVLGSP